MRWFYTMVMVVMWPLVHLLYPMFVAGKENIPAGACIICVNHSNFVDPFLIIFAFGFKNFLRCMSKTENMRMPVLGWIFKMCGAFGVERGKTDMGAVRKTVHILREGGKVVIFPEGTRVEEDYTRPAKTGAVRMASMTGAPLLPVFLTRKKRLFRRVDIVIGKPYAVSAHSHEEYDRLSDELLRGILDLNPAV